jgi:predicted nucleotidyltransferase
MSRVLQSAVPSRRYGLTRPRAELVLFLGEGNAPQCQPDRSRANCCNWRHHHAPSLHIDEAALTRFCNAHHLRRLSVFGSPMKSTAGPGSDIDLVVELDPEHISGLLSIAGMEIEPSELFGRKVGLHTAGDLSRHFRDEVVHMAEVQYAA